MHNLLHLFFMNKIVSETWTSVAVHLCMSVEHGCENRSVRMIKCPHRFCLLKQNICWKSTIKAVVLISSDRR